MAKQLSDLLSMRRQILFLQEVENKVVRSYMIGITPELPCLNGQIYESSHINKILNLSSTARKLKLHKKLLEIRVLAACGFARTVAPRMICS